MQEKVLTITDELVFQYGPGCKSFEQQANEQGYTLAKHADRIQQLGNALTLLYLEKLLNSAQYNSAVKRLHKQLVGLLLPMSILR